MCKDITETNVYELHEMSKGIYGTKWDDKVIGVFTSLNQLCDKATVTSLDWEKEFPAYKVEKLNEKEEDDIYRMTLYKQDIISEVDGKKAGFTRKLVLIGETNGLDEVCDEIWQKYLVYLQNWVIEHRGCEYKTMSPACYDEWLDNEWEEGRIDGETLSENHS